MEKETKRITLRLPRDIWNALQHVASDRKANGAEPDSLSGVTAAALKADPEVALALGRIRRARHRAGA